MFGHATYLFFELLWGLPVLVVQWLFGWKRLIDCRRPLTFAVLITTVYLTIADGIAIHMGVWSIHPDRIVGVVVFGVPLEEAIFFLVTDVMVVQTVLLLWPRGWIRHR